MVSAAGSSPDGLRRALANYAAAAVTAAAGWWALLGWDTHKTLGSDGYLHGPVEPWQVMASLAVLGLLAVWLGHRHSLLAGPGVAAIALAVCFGMSAELDSHNDGLWGVGAILILFGSFAGIAVIAVGTQLIEHHVRSPH